jgi:hypothetical protein
MQKKLNVRLGERVAECPSGLDETRIEASIHGRDCVRERIAIGPILPWCPTVTSICDWI